MADDERVARQYASSNPDLNELDDEDDVAGMLNRLGTPFDRSVVKQRKIGGGKTVSYVSGQSVIRRLNEAVGVWDLHVVERWTEVVTVNRWNEDERRTIPVDLPCLCMLVELHIPGLGTRQGVGVQVKEPGAGEDAMKGVLTDATKNAAKQFGVALELYGDDVPRESGERVDPGTGEIQAVPEAMSEGAKKFFRNLVKEHRVDPDAVVAEMQQRYGKTHLDDLTRRQGKELTNGWLKPMVGFEDQGR